MIVMIHGMWATSSIWDRYHQFFEDNGYTVSAVTLLHHGEAPEKLRHIGILDYVKQLEDVIRLLHDRLTIIGHSMGGLIAQKIAEKGLAEKLVLISPGAPGGIPSVTPSVALTFSANLCDVFFGIPFIIPFRNASWGLMNTLSYDDRVTEYGNFVYESGLAARESAIGKIRVDETKITCPVLVVVGEQDRATPPKVVRKVATKYKAQYIEYPDHCHHSVIAGPGWSKVAGDILEWLKETRR